MAKTEPDAHASSDITWSHLYDAWCNAWIDAPGRTKPTIVDMVFEDRDDGYALPKEVVDWWPTHEIEARRARLRDEGRIGVTWETRRGVVTTAEMLRNVGEAPEHLAMVWLAACLWELEDAYLGEQPAPGLRRTLHDCKLTAVRAARGLDVGDWYHSCKQLLPARALTGRLGNMLHPTSPADLVELARLQALAVMASWTIVRVRNPTWRW
jgi:hypothetical protein